MDKITKYVIKFLYGVAYNCHFDYASLIWDQMKHLVRTRDDDQRDYIPFTRFFSLIINHFIKNTKDLHISENAPIYFNSPMKYMKRNIFSSIARPMPLPEYLLSMANQQNKAVIEYRVLHGRMVPVQPQEPAPRPHRETGEGSSQEKREKRKRKSEGKRTEGVQNVETVPVQPENVQVVNVEEQGGVSLDSPVEPKPQTSTKTPSSSSGRKKSIHKKRRIHSHTPLATIHESSDTTVTPQAESDPIQSQTPESLLATGSGNDDSTPEKFAHAFEYDAFDEYNRRETQGRNEGVVEKEIASERSGCETGSKKSDDPPRTSPERRQTTSAIGVHVLHSGIEKAVGSQPTHALTLRSHSDSSQQGFVSSSHGDYTHTLSTSHSEMSDIESRDALPRSLLSLSARSFTSLIQSSQLSSLRGSAHLRDVAGTSVESIVTIATRGSLGNPVIVNTMPALNTGYSMHSSSAIDVSTGSLSDPGHVISPTLSASSYRLIDSLVQGRLRRETPMTHSRMAGFTIASSSISPTQLPSFHTSQSTTTITTTNTSISTAPFTPEFSSTIPLPNLTISAIRNALHTRLLIEASSLSPSDALLLGFLNTNTPSTSPPQVSQLEARLDVVTNELDLLKKRMSEVESKCKPDIPASSRRHDDPDSADQHEGENRGFGTSGGYQSTYFMSNNQETGGPSESSQGGGVQEEEEEYYFGEPISMIEPVSLLEFGDVFKPLIDENEDDGEFENLVHVEEEELQKYMNNREVIDIESDNDDDFDEFVLNEKVKEEEEEKQQDVEIETDSDEVKEVTVESNKQQEQSVDELSKQKLKGKAIVEDNVIEEFEDIVGFKTPTHPSQASSSVTPEFPPGFEGFVYEDGDFDLETFEKLKTP